MEEVFKKYQMVEMSDEDTELWRWICREKNKWKKVSKVRAGQARINIDSGGNPKFTFVVSDI